MRKAIDSRQILSDNLKRLMQANSITQKGIELAAKKAGNPIDQTYVGRILRNEVAATVEKLESISAAFGLQTWQLLIPHLDPTNLPILQLDPLEKQLYEKIRVAAQELAQYEPGESK